MNRQTYTVAETVADFMWDNTIMGAPKLRRLIRDKMRYQLSKMEPLAPSGPRVWRVTRFVWDEGLTFRLIVGPDAPRYGRQLRHSRKVFR